jgi:hypothetical protein
MMPSNRLKFGYVYRRQVSNDISKPLCVRSSCRVIEDTFKKPETKEDEKADAEQEGRGILSEIHKSLPPRIHKQVMKERKFLCSKALSVKDNKLKNAFSMLANQSMRGRGLSIPGGGLGVPGGGLGLPGDGLGLPGDGLGLPGDGMDGGAFKPQMLPGDMLKLKLLKNISKQKESVLDYKPSRGGGIGRRANNEPMTGNGTLTGSGKTMDLLNKLVISTGKFLFPELVRRLKQAKVGNFSGNGLSGAGKKNLMRLLKIRFKKVLPKTKTLKNISRHLMPVAKEGSKLLLPILLKMAKTKMSGGAKHNSKLRILLARELHTGLKQLQGKGLCGQHLTQSGSGLFGKSNKWWKEFGHGFVKGFKMVAKPGAKILGATATALGQPEFGIPLGLASELL